MNSQLTKEKLKMLITEDNAHISDDQGNQVTLSNKQFLKLCDVCSEYLGISRSEIDRAILSLIQEDTPHV